MSPKNLLKTAPALAAVEPATEPAVELAAELAAQAAAGSAAEPAAAIGAAASVVPAARMQPQSLPPADPHALGATLCAEGVAFALWAPEATAVELCVFDADGAQELTRWPLQHCSHGVWHGLLAGAGAGLVYGWRVHGPWAPEQGHRFNAQRVLVDPYATELVGSYGGDLSLYLGHEPGHPTLPAAGDNAAVALKARVPAALPPANEARPQIDPAQRVIAEVHVKAISQLHPAVPEALRGSYAALAHPALIAHWQQLGITTLELMPLQQRTDEAHLLQRGLRNHWGYSTLNYFAVEPRYWSGTPGTTPASELREAVRALHAAGFEVLLDVVYNHTAETDENGPTLSYRGLANRQYYRLQTANPALYDNWAGCGNVLNMAEPAVLRLVLDSMRHWVEAIGVDGFRFDLAPVLGCDARGEFRSTNAFFAALQADPVLRRVALIAEPWDMGPGGYQLGGFPPGWLEWNDRYRDALRATWLHPQAPQANRGAFAQRFAGSSQHFNHSGRSPLASVNFITAHDGFTLRDLVSYNHRHNAANGEHNRDGHSHNLSWNAGAEGPSSDPAVLALRTPLQRALLASLLLSQGTPMLLAGDEMGHSQHGNNNAYCQDNALTWLDWAASTDDDLAATITRLLALRRAHPVLRSARWWGQAPGPQGEGVTAAWLRPDGLPLQGSDWDQPGALAIHLTALTGDDEALLLIHPGPQPLPFVLPFSRTGAAWRQAFDSHAHAGAPASPNPPDAGHHLVSARSLQLLLPADSRSAANPA
jgi:glycogen operon protein